jgi:hypothetical protein
LLLPEMSEDRQRSFSGKKVVSRLGLGRGETQEGLAICVPFD